MYTRGAAWYLNREDDLGSIEEGKLADLSCSTATTSR